MGGMGGGGGAAAFPAPGVTDTTPGQDGARAAQTGASQPPPVNPFAMFGNPAAGAGTGAGAGTAGNPFAALFNPSGLGNTPSATPPPTASAGQGTPAAPGTPGTTNGQNLSQPPNPFAALGNPNANANSMFQNPALMQQMLAAMGNGAPPAAPGNEGAAAFNPFASMFGPGGMMGGMGAGAGAAPAPPDTRPPEERYAEQLRQLNDMGFYEFERNIEALRRTGGSVQGAVEYLLTH